MAMNDVVTLHQPVCLYSAAGEEGEPPKPLTLAKWWTARGTEYFNRLSATSSGKVFSDLQHSEAFVFFADRARYEKRSSTAKGLLLGSSTPSKVLKAKTLSTK
jgi:hypothetical protein